VEIYVPDPIACGFKIQPKLLQEAARRFCIPKIHGANEATYGAVVLRHGSRAVEIYFSGSLLALARSTARDSTAT
jgi:hypothetical protein